MRSSSADSCYAAGTESQRHVRFELGQIRPDATAHFGKWHLEHNLPANDGDRYEPPEELNDLISAKLTKA